MADLHYTDYLYKVRGCALGLGDMTWIEPALRVLAHSGMDFTAEELAQAYEKGGALTPHFLRNMDRGIDPPLAVFDDPERVGPGGMDCAPLWACACPGDPARARAYAERDAAVDHEGEAVEAAGFLASAMSLAFVRDSATACIREAASALPEESRLARLALDACALCEKDPATARVRMEWRYGGVDGSLLPRLTTILLALLLGDQPDRLAAAFRGLLEGASSSSDVGDAMAARMARAGLMCMAMAAERGEKLPVRVTAAPFVAVPAARKAERKMSVHFLGAPVLAPGKARQCVLRIENPSDELLEGEITCETEGCVQAMTAAHAKVLPGEDARIPFTVWMPEDVKTVTECNRMTVRFCGLEKTFGIAGAQGYRVCGRMGVSDRPIYEGRSLPENPIWEPYFANGNRIHLDEINGWVGPCSFVLERKLRISEDLEADIAVERTCPYVLELDGETILSGDGTDGWTVVRAEEPAVQLSAGEHTMRLFVERRAPGGSIEVDFLCDGRLLSLAAENPLQEGE